MDRLDLILKIQQSNNSWTFEEIKLFIDLFFDAIKEEYKNGGTVDLGEWAVFVYQKQESKKSFLTQFSRSQKTKSANQRIYSPIPATLKDNLNHDVGLRNPATFHKRSFGRGK